MRAYQITPHQSLDEVSMRQSELTSAIEQGQGAGVLVGFEFEVCVPAAYFGRKQIDSSVTPSLIQDAFSYNQFTDTHVGDYLTLDEFDQLFKLKTPGKYSSAREAMLAKMNRVIPELKDIWESIPEQDRVTMRQAINRRGGWDKIIEKLSYPDEIVKLMPPELKFMRSVLYVIRMNTELNTKYGSSRTRPEHVSNRIIALIRDTGGTERGWTFITEWGWTLTEYTGVKLLDIDYSWNRLFMYDPQKVYEIMSNHDFDFHEQDEDYFDEDEEYRKAADKFAKELKTTYGRKVQVFDSYHEESKNLKDWYIEPDSSLDPNGGDASFEVVSPPYPALDAAKALTEFYSLAKKNGFYTSAKNKTGLHINVSIPQNIDVLKLALILGDQHVLKTFGRENNMYAQSVYSKLQNPKGVSGEQLATPKIPTQQKIKILNGIINTATTDHYASITSNGKYISFRHAGGNYLNDYASVVNVVGRFVRAMIIASDPQSHREDYLRELGRIIISLRREPTLVKQMVEMHKYGLPVLHVDAYTSSKSTKAPNKAVVLGWFMKSGASAVAPARGLTSFLQPDPSAEARMIASLGDQADLVQDNPGGKSWSGVWAPSTMDQYNALLRNSYEGLIEIKNTSGWYGRTVGYAIVRTELLPKNDPRAARAFNNIYQQLRQEYAKVKK